MANTIQFSCPMCKTRLSAPAERACPMVICPRCQIYLDLSGLDPGATKWYVIRGDVKLGPYSTEAMKWLAATTPARLAPHDLVQADGIPTPVKASEVMEFYPPPQEWYIIRDRMKYGPYSTERMKGFVKDSIVRPYDIVQTPGKLTSASLVEQLFPTSSNSSKKGMIYLISVPPWDRHYKIGKTNRISPDTGLPEIRLKELGVLLPQVPRLVHHIETNHIGWAETHWHQRFRKKWTNGEWYCLDDDDIEEFSSCLEMVFHTDRRKEFVVVACCRFSAPIQFRTKDGVCYSATGHLTHPQGLRRP